MIDDKLSISVHDEIILFYLEMIYEKCNNIFLILLSILYQ